MKKLIFILFILGLSYNCYSQRLIRIVTGTSDGSFMEPVKCYRYDSTKVDILVWKFQKLLDEAWEKTKRKEIFDFDFEFNLRTARSNVEENIKNFDISLFTREWELYQGFPDEIRGPYKYKE